MPHKAVLVGEKRIIEMRVFVRFWIVIAFVVLLGLFPAHSSEFASIYCKYTSGQTMTSDGAEELEIGAAGYDAKKRIVVHRFKLQFVAFTCDVR